MVGSGLYRILFKYFSTQEREFLQGVLNDPNLLKEFNLFLLGVIYLVHLTWMALYICTKPIHFQCTLTLPRENNRKP